MSNQYDVIIIGAGHNGLVCANTLAKRGKKVLILEANKDVGGLACSREFTPGFNISSCAHLLYGLHPKVYTSCLLDQPEPEFAAINVDTLVINQNREFINYSSGQDSQIIYSSSLSDREVLDWNDFQQQMRKFTDLLFSLADKIPPRLKNGSLQDYKTLANAGLKLRRLDKDDMRQFLRIVGMNVYDLVEETFDSDLLKASVCYESIIGTRLGPRAPNTVYNWLNRYSTINQNASGICLPKGGMGALSKLFAQAAMDKGVDISISSRVAKILVSENEAKGVLLTNGTKYGADTIVSNADIKTTMLSLVGTSNLDTEVVRRVTHIPMQGSTAKMHLALSQLPESITNNSDDFRSRIIFSPDAEYIERASNAIKYDEYATEPVFEISIPSAVDHSLAPAGKHVMSVLIPYVPYQHKNGWANEKERFENHILEHLEYIFPGIRVTTEYVETLTPLDIEEQFNVTGGHWHHGEIGLERFMMLRPSPGFAQYQTPIEGLYLCGADCHPGGDVNGVAGLNAADAVTKVKS